MGETLGEGGFLQCLSLARLLLTKVSFDRILMTLVIVISYWLLKQGRDTNGKVIYFINSLNMSPSFKKLNYEQKFHIPHLIVPWGGFPITDLCWCKLISDFCWSRVQDTPILSEIICKQLLTQCNFPSNLHPATKGPHHFHNGTKSVPLWKKWDPISDKGCYTKV